MGIWETVVSTAEGFKQRFPDPALLKSAYGFGASALNAARSSAASAIFQRSSSTTSPTSRLNPEQVDPSSLKKACSSALNTARAASPDLSAASAICLRSAFWIDRTVRVDAPRRFTAVVTDPDFQSRVVRTAWSLLDHALDFGTQHYMGGIPAYKIVKEGLFSGDCSAEGDELNDMKKRLEKLEALVASREGKGVAAVEIGILESGALRYDHRMMGLGGVIESFMMVESRDGDFLIEQKVVDVNRIRARKDFLLCKLD